MRYSLYLTVPFAIMLIMLIYNLIRNIGRSWLEHRVKLVLLELLERRPDLLRSFTELEDLLENPLQEDEAANHQDLTLTGVILAIIGVICAVLYANFGKGRWAIGAYWGGVACVVIGFILAMTGLGIRYLAKSPLKRGKTP
jgi:hypothetical protein